LSPENSTTQQHLYSAITHSTGKQLYDSAHDLRCMLTWTLLPDELTWLGYGCNAKHPKPVMMRTIVSSCML
jgi:hypothetical protein